MKKKPLRVSLHAREASVVELKLGDRVQLDRVMPSPRGCRAERHGHLLAPGTTAVALAPGHYFFRTLSDASLRVVTGGVSAGITAHADDKDGDWPDPQKSEPGAKGDEAPGESPNLTIEHA